MINDQKYQSSYFVDKIYVLTNNVGKYNYMSIKIQGEGVVMTGRKPRIDKGVPKKGIHPMERETIIKVKKQDKAAKKALRH